MESAGSGNPSKMSLQFTGFGNLSLFTLKSCVGDGYGLNSSGMESCSKASVAAGVNAERFIPIKITRSLVSGTPKFAACNTCGFKTM